MFEFLLCGTLPWPGPSRCPVYPASGTPLLATPGYLLTDDANSEPQVFWPKISNSFLIRAIPWLEIQVYLWNFIPLLLCNPGNLGQGKQGRRRLPSPTALSGTLSLESHSWSLTRDSNPRVHPKERCNYKPVTGVTNTEALLTVKVGKDKSLRRKDRFHLDLWFLPVPLVLYTPPQRDTVLQLRPRRTLCPCR